MANSPSSASVIRFGAYEVDVLAGELRKNGLKIRIQDQPFQVLVTLLRRPGEVITREELREKLWPDHTFVDFDQGLNTAINKIREALSDSASNPRFVETLPRRGYRFLAPVEAPRSGEIPSRSAAQPSISQQQPWWQRRTFALLVPLSMLAAGIIVGIWLRSPEPAREAHVRRFAFTPGRTDVRSPAISPDGRHIVYAAQGRLWVQDLDQEGPREIGGTESMGLFPRPFWSPDSEFIAFAASGELKKISVAGGQPISLCQIPGAGAIAGGTWSPDGDSIVFSAWVDSRYRLYEIAAHGGTPEPLLAPERSQQLEHPHFLSLDDRRRILLFTMESLEAERETRVVLRDLDTGAEKTLVNGAAPAYCSSGHIVYQQTGLTETARGLLAVPISTDTLKPTGEAFSIAENGASPSVSHDGTLVYLDWAGETWQLVWRDRGGKKLGVIGQPQDDIAHLALSPDGGRVAVRGTEGGNHDIWVHDVHRAIKTRLTHHEALDVLPVWHPSGDSLLFNSRRAGYWDIYTRRTDGSDDTKALAASSSPRLLRDCSLDGQYILYTTEPTEAKPDWDIWYLKRKNNGTDWEPAPFLRTEFNESGPRFSPDNRYVAYVSDISGREELYVREFPGAGNKVQISGNGGLYPRWRKDGKELFYVEGNTLVAVAVSTAPSFAVGGVNRLFQSESLRLPRRYDVSADGQRIVVAEPVEPGAPPVIRVVQNWHAQFRDRQE